MCDNRHNISDGKIHDMGKAWETLCIAIEEVDAFAIEDVLNLIACGVIVASVVSSDAEQLAGRVK